MRPNIGRRTATRRMALQALAPFALLAWPSAAASVRSVSLPLGSFRLERILTRGLADGAEITVTRQWRVGFARQKSGMAVTGEQIHVSVASPPRLAPLAEIERTRSTASLFPILLDEAGLIRRETSGGNDGDAMDFERALDSGRVMIERLALSAAELRDARSFLAKLATMGPGAVSWLPQDLFFPRVGTETATRDLAMPDGATGSVTITALTRAVPVSGLLDRAERRIITRLSGSERSTFESWTLTQF